MAKKYSEIAPMDLGSTRRKKKAYKDIQASQNVKPKSTQTSPKNDYNNSASEKQSATTGKAPEKDVAAILREKNQQRDAQVQENAAQDVAAILREKNQKRDRQYEDLFANKYAGMSYAEMYKDIEAMRSKRNTAPSATLDVEIEAAEKYAKAHKYDSLTTEELKAELDKANAAADAGNPSLLESVFGIIGSGNKNDKNQWLIDAKNEVEQAYINRLAFEAESADELKAKLDGYIPSYEMLADPRNLTDPDSAFNSDKKLLEQAYKTRLVNDANAANGGEARLAELKSEIAELKKQPDSDALVKAKQAEYDALYHGVHGDANLGQYLYDILDTGAAGFNKSLSATADATLGNLLDAVGWEDNLFRRWNRWHDEQLNAAQGRLKQSTAAMGEGAGWGIGAEFGKGAVQALPDAIIALLSAGGSTATKLGAPTTGLLNTVRESLQGLAKNPQYWTSMIQEYGTSYEQAKSEGASETAALTTATLSSLLNSAVEIGGGLQTIPDELLNNRGNKKAIRTWVEGMLDEGKEEVVQGVISNLTSAVVYDQDREIFSMEDESAVINPARMAKEFAMGAAVGGILGGGQIGVASTMNRLSGADTNLDTSGRFGDVVALDSKGNSVQVAKYNPIQSVEDGRVVLNTTAGAASTKDITFTNSFLPQLYEYAANNYGVTGGNMYVRGYENAKQHNADVNIDTYTGVFNEVASQVRSGKSEDTIRKSMAAQIDVVGEPAFLYAVTGAESIVSARSVDSTLELNMAETAKNAAQESDIASRKSFTSDDGYDTINTDAKEGAGNNVREEARFVGENQESNQSVLRETDGLGAAGDRSGRAGSLYRDTEIVQQSKSSGQAERRTVKRRIKTTDFEYTEAADTDHSAHAAAIKAEYDALGIDSTVIEGKATATRKGETKAINGESTTLPDGSVIVRNDANTAHTSKETAGHEMYHVAGIRAYTEADTFRETISDGGVDFSNNRFIELADEIRKAYGDDFSIINNPKKFYEELCGFVSGDLFQNSGKLSEDFAAMFHAPDAVEAAWAQMRTKFKPNNQNNSRSDGGGINSTSERVNEYLKGNAEDWATAEKDARLYDTAYQAAKAYNAGLEESEFSAFYDAVVQMSENEISSALQNETKQNIKEIIGQPAFDLAYAVGATQRTTEQKTVQEIGKKLGRQVVFENTVETQGFKSDGYIDSNGVIHIDRKTTNPLQFVLKHELTHFIENSPGRYNELANDIMDSEFFRGWVKSKGYASASEYNAALVQMYSKHVKNFGEKQANEEMLANFVGENLFGDSTEAIEKLLNALEPEKRRTFIEMVKDFFAKIKQKFTKNESALSQIERFEDQFIKAYRAVQAEFEQKNTAENGGVKYSFASEKSQARIEWAEELERQGKSRDEIWQEIGLIRDPRGVWLHEIDDSGFRIKTENGGHPPVRKYLTPLDRFVRHDKLYEEYPQMRDAQFKVGLLSDSDHGAYLPADDLYPNSRIYLNEDIQNTKEEKTVDIATMHETQHMMQDEDGRLIASSPQVWADWDQGNGYPILKHYEQQLQNRQKQILDSLSQEDRDAYLQVNELYQELINVGPTHGVPDGEARRQRMIQISKQRDKLLASIQDKPWYRELTEIEEVLADRQHLAHDAYYDAYFNTISEIEARETADRLRMTSEERRAKTPDLGWDRAFFWKEEGGEQRLSVFDEDNASAQSAAESDKQYAPVFSTSKNAAQADGETRYSYSAATENSDVLELVEKVKRGAFKANDRVFFENVSDALASNIYQLTGIDVKGFKVAVEGRQIEHILKDHGENGRTDHSMSNDADIAKMEFALKYPSSISKAGKTSAYSYMKDGRNRTADTILYEKEIGDKSYYVVQAVADTNKKTLYIVSAFIGQKGYKKGTSQSINAKSPDATSKNAAVIVPTNNISNPVENVKQNPDELSGNSYSISEQDGIELLEKYKRGELSAKEAFEKISGSQKSDAETPEKPRAIQKPQKKMLWESDEIQALLKKYGALPKGENATVDIEVPKKTADDRNVRRFTRTVLESGVVTEDMLDVIEDAVLDDALSYTPISDEKAVQYAERTAKNQGMRYTKLKWNEIVHSARLPRKGDIAIGEYLLRAAAESGDKAALLQYTAEVAQIGTIAGQAVQAMSLLKKMGGAGELVAIKRAVDKENEEIERKYKGKKPPVKLNVELAEQLVRAKTKAERDAIRQEILRDVAEQIPSSFLDKWNAWRYLAMLGNLRTHIRNIVGNSVFAPAVWMKNRVAYGLESVFAKDSKTKALTVPKDIKQFAEQDWEEMKDIIMSDGKLNPGDIIRDNRRIFKPEILEMARRLNFDLLGKEDGFFLKRYYRAALGSYLASNKVDVQNIDAATLQKAREYAVNEARKATYRDASAVATALSNVSRRNKALNLVVEGILPFKKTPINILKRGVEYSPAGLLFTLGKGTYSLVKEDITINEYIDGISAGFTGTAVFAVGMLLGYLGIAVGGLGDDKEDKFKKLQGMQSYSIQIAGKSYTIDFAAPASIPFFMGVELSGMFEEDGEITVSDVMDAIQNSAQPMVEMSMLSGLSSAIETVGNSKNVLGDLAMNTLTSYGSQAVPTALGQVARTVDPVSRRTYADKNIPLVNSGVQIAAGKVVNKIPGLSTISQPALDEWGREYDTGNMLQRGAENFLSPGYANVIKTTRVDEALDELYEETGEVDVLPSKPQKYVTVDKEKIYFTAEEYTNFAKLKGQTSYNLINRMISKSAYKKMSSEQKVKAIQKVYAYAHEIAKESVTDYEIGENDWENKAKKSGDVAGYILDMVEEAED